MPRHSLRSYLIKSMNLDNRHVNRKSTQTFLEDLSFLEEVQSLLCFQWQTMRKYTFFSQAKLKYERAIPNPYQKALLFLLSKASMLIFSRLWIGYWMMSKVIFYLLFYEPMILCPPMWCFLNPPSRTSFKNQHYIYDSTWLWGTPGLQVQNLVP